MVSMQALSFYFHRKSTVFVIFKVKYIFADLLDRSEIKIEEILRQTRSGGPILRKVALPKLGTNVEILFKLDLILFSPL